MISTIVILLYNARYEKEHENSRRKEQSKTIVVSTKKC